MIHSYPWYIADWRGSEAVLGMNLEQKGLYRELLDHCWERGSLPVDEKLLRQISCATAWEFKRAWPKVRQQFTEVDGRLHHIKVDEKREELERWHQERKESGKRGAEKRWAEKHDSSANSSAIGPAIAPHHSHPHPLPLPLPLEESKPHTQERSSVVERSPQKANGVCMLPTSPKFTEFWARWPRQVGMDSAFAAWNSYVHAGDEPLVFACLERFLASGDAERGAIPMAGPTNGKSGWLADCARDGWKCQWPTRAPPTQRSLTPTDQAIQEAKQRAKRTN